MSPRSALKGLHRRFQRSESGLAAMEVALFAPVLMAVLLGGVDVTRFVLVHSKVAKVGFYVSDVAAQYKQMSRPALDDVFRYAGETFPTYVSGVNGVIVLTAVSMDSSKKQVVTWQCYSTASTSSGFKSQWTSKIGAEKAVASVPASLLIDANDYVIVSEVFFDFKPMFSWLFKTNFDIYSKSFFRPRLGTLTTKPC